MKQLNQWIDNLSKNYDRHKAKETDFNHVLNFSLNGYEFYIWANHKGILAKPGHHKQASVDIVGDAEDWLAGRLDKLEAPSKEYLTKTPIFPFLGLLRVPDNEEPENDLDEETEEALLSL